MWELAYFSFYVRVNFWDRNLVGEIMDNNQI